MSKTKTSDIKEKHLIKR